MGIGLQNGISNINEYYTNHYFSTIFEDNAADTIKAWNDKKKDDDEYQTPWARLRRCSTQFYPAHDRYIRSSMNMQMLVSIRALAEQYLTALDYPEANPENIVIDDSISAPVFLELTKSSGAPLLWVILSASTESDTGILESNAIDSLKVADDASGGITADVLTEINNEDLATRILFSSNEPPRFLLFIGMNQIALIDRNKWNEKRYLQFELEEIFSRLENNTLQAMAVLLHKESLCPDDGRVLLDELDEQSQKNASGVSQDLKYALRESIELLGNEVLYDMRTRQGRNMETDPVDAGQLTIECLRYMYRMLFVLFIESRTELGYAPMKAQSYLTAYSLQSLRDIVDDVRDDVDEVGGGYYLHDTLAKLYDLIYFGYPKTEAELEEAVSSESLHDMFLVAPLKAHIFDPEYTAMITKSKLRNSCMLRIIDLMSLTRPTGRRGERRQRISYANLGINQMGAVYEALLSYRGFIAEHDLYEVKRAGDTFNELDVGYFVSESELDQYTEDERVRYEHGDNKGKLRMYKKGTFIYRLAGREREKSASYYTPEVLTKCLVKYALKELLEDKTADEILELTICEPAMGSAAFLNEAINQLAEAYIDRKQKELGETIPYDQRFNELQKVKMYIADRNVYGIDLNPVAVELAEVSLWLNTIFEGGYVPWFNTQLVNGNSLIGARRQCYRVENVQTTVSGARWYELEPERLPFDRARAEGKGVTAGRRQIYHFLLGDPGMCSYNDKVIKTLEPDNIKRMKDWNKSFTKPINEDEATTMLNLSAVIDKLWEAQINLRKEIEAKTQDNLSVYGHEDTTEDSHTTIRQKDLIYRELYKSEHMQNAGPYARLKFAMDYWCALWFWPIDKAEILPTRSEFLFDMSLILEGTMGSVSVNNAIKGGQLSWIASETEQLAMDILDTYGTENIVDIPKLRKENPRLDLAAQIAEKNNFIHWELEFADLFYDRGGFDIIVGNPPWIKLEWNEKNILSEYIPKLVIKNITATKASNERDSALKHSVVRELYLEEYIEISAQQNFLNASQNYQLLKGQQTNLYKCFIPKSWQMTRKTGISAFIHPEGIYDDPKAGNLRKEVYSRLRLHLQFQNEKKLFSEVANRAVYSINIYSNVCNNQFESISNLFTPATVDQCYSAQFEGAVGGIKDENDEWNVKGHKDRIIRIGKEELLVFAKIFDGNMDWEKARLPVIHTRQLVEVLNAFSSCSKNIGALEKHVFSTAFWDETNAQNDKIIARFVHFPKSDLDCILSGPHIGVANPLFQSSRKNCSTHRAFDNIDLNIIDADYLQRCNYKPNIDYVNHIPKTPWDTLYTDEYRIVLRKMMNQSGERTLIPAIIPPKVAYINGIFGMAINTEDFLSIAGSLASLPFDFYIKSAGKANCRYDTIAFMPLIDDGYYSNLLARRAALLNFLTKKYSTILKHSNFGSVQSDGWSKSDNRLDKFSFSRLEGDWSEQLPLRNDFERRQALVEIDVIVAMALGLSLNQLCSIYRIQFPVLKEYEDNTWFDANGRIVFTNNRSLVGVGFSRNEFENGIKDAPAGKKFYRIIADDTMPGGLVERTIEYVAPFDCCDREKDYEMAWKFFEEKHV